MRFQLRCRCRLCGHPSDTMNNAERHAFKKHGYRNKPLARAEAIEVLERVEEQPRPAAT